MIVKIEDAKGLDSLFAFTEDTAVRSCLQGVMGEIYATPDGHSVMARLGDYGYCTGVPDRELLTFVLTKSGLNEITLVPADEEWEKLISQCYGIHADRVTRYALLKEGLQVFDRQQLLKAVEGLPAEYELRMMDRDLYEQCDRLDWCREWVENYPTYELYEQYGLGAVILKDGEPVAGASSFSGYPEGIEVIIRTKEEYQKHGLAYVCASGLILACMERNLYPSWDAANLKSLGLSRKLGYHFKGEYTAYHVKLG